MNEKEKDVVAVYVKGGIAATRREGIKDNYVYRMLKKYAVVPLTKRGAIESAPAPTTEAPDIAVAAIKLLGACNGDVERAKRALDVLSTL